MIAQRLPADNGGFARARGPVPIGVRAFGVDVERMMGMLDRGRHDSRAG
jgi:hypothetical protein